MSVFARTADAGYVYDPKWEQETARLLANQAIWDRGTIERLDRLGVTDGWTCLEIGAGCGSIARRLVELTGSGGRVMATDLVTERLEWLRAHGVEVRRHDVTADELPDRAFDLIHARMVMQHLPDRETVVTRLRNALRPGGWLYLEDTDPSPAFRAAAEDPALAVVVPAGYQVMREAGFDDRGGQADVEVMLQCGLEDVSADGRVELVQGGSTQSRNYVLWLDYLGPRIRARGLADDDLIRAAREWLGDPSHRWLSQVMISAFGRRPLDSASTGGQVIAGERRAIAEGG